MIQLSPLTKEDLPNCFLAYKKALYPYIQEAFLWDEQFQKNRFQTRYEPHNFYNIKNAQQYIGFVCFYEHQKELHISLLIIYESFQRQGYGKKMMDLLHRRADQKSLLITLSSFKNNTPALNFYQRLQYTIVGQDTYFVDLQREPTPI